jgi:hypothetical protein
MEDDMRMWFRCAHFLTNRIPAQLSCAAATMALAAAAMPPVIGRAADRPVAAISITTVDREVTGFGTFQSHNQKVVSTPHGIFMT